MQHKFSLHKISSESNFSFDPNEYSRFKYGDDIIAEKFGEELANSFISQIMINLPFYGKQFLVIPSPYSFIPTATFALKSHFVNVLNRWLVDNHYPPVEETKIHRTVTYKDDYGDLDNIERLELIKNDKFYIDKDFIKNKVLIFLDDIRITGSHEKMIISTLEKFEIKNDFYLLYYAELMNLKIHPRIENVFNNYYVKSLSDLQPIINGERFKFNTRLVKFILNSKFSDCSNFLLKQNNFFLNEMYNLSIGNGYHTIDEYKDNLNYLKTLVITKLNQKLEYGY